MSNDKVEATFHPDQGPSHRARLIAVLVAFGWYGIPTWLEARHGRQTRAYIDKTRPIGTKGSTGAGRTTRAYRAQDIDE